MCVCVICSVWVNDEHVCLQLYQCSHWRLSAELRYMRTVINEPMCQCASNMKLISLPFAHNRVTISIVRYPTALPKMRAVISNFLRVFCFRSNEWQLQCQLTLLFRRKNCPLLIGWSNYIVVTALRLLDFEMQESSTAAIRMLFRWSEQKKN